MGLLTALSVSPVCGRRGSPTFGVDDHPEDSYQMVPAHGRRLQRLDEIAAQRAEAVFRERGERPADRTAK
jgi:hypothetical protein